MKALPSGNVAPTRTPSHQTAMRKGLLTMVTELGDPLTRLGTMEFGKRQRRSSCILRDQQSLPGLKTQRRQCSQEAIKSEHKKGSAWWLCRMGLKFEVKRLILRGKVSHN